MESYVGHVRTLTEARDALALEFEKENEQLRMEFLQLKCQQGNSYLRLLISKAYQTGLSLGWKSGKSDEENDCLSLCAPLYRGLDFPGTWNASLLSLPSLS